MKFKKPFHRLLSFPGMLTRQTNITNFDTSFYYFYKIPSNIHVDPHRQYGIYLDWNYFSVNIITYLLASERSERDTYRGNTIENRGCLFICLYICLDVRMSFCTFM